MSMVLLLTATIHPLNIKSSKGRNNHFVREEDYFLAVKFYLSRGYKVIFVENSNTRSERILNLQTSDLRLEYHAFMSELSHKGKSWGEIEIINFALNNSEFLNEVEYIIKISGRYIIKNIDQLLNPTCQVEKEVYINPTRNFRWADSRLMIMKKTFYTNYLLKTVHRFLNEDKKVYMENVFIKSVLLYLYEGGELVLWPTYPLYDAFDGTHNDKVSFGFFKSLKYKIYYKIKRGVFKHRA